MLVPAAVVGGSLLFGDKQYAYLTLCVAVLSCLPFFLHFEHGRADAKEMILIAADGGAVGGRTFSVRAYSGL